MTDLSDEEITGLLFVEDELERGQCALVLGSVSPSEMRRRVACAAEIYKRGLVDRLVLSGGGSVTAEPEAVMMAKVAIELGVPEDRILREAESTNTFENARLSHDLLVSEGLLDDLDTLLLVTSGWHMGRSAVTVRNALPDRVRVVCCPTREGCTRDTWTESEACRKLVRQEAGLFQVFLAAGLLTPSP